MDYNQFREFVFAQDDDKTIDHQGGWATCAVGEALAYFHDDPSGRMGAIFGLESELDHSDENPHYLLRECLNHDGVPPHATMVAGWDGGDIDTYGDLKKFIQFLGI